MRLASGEGSAESARSSLRSGFLWAVELRLRLRRVRRPRQRYLQWFVLHVCLALAGHGIEVRWVEVRLVSTRSAVKGVLVMSHRAQAHEALVGLLPQSDRC